MENAFPNKKKIKKTVLEKFKIKTEKLGNILSSNKKYFEIPIYSPFLQFYWTKNYCYFEAFEVNTEIIAFKYPGITKTLKTSHKTLNIIKYSEWEPKTGKFKFWSLLSAFI